MLHSITPLCYLPLNADWRDLTYFFMKLADVVSKLNTLDDAVGPLAAYLVVEMILWVVYGVYLVGLRFFVPFGAQLPWLCRSGRNFLWEVLILVLVAWRGFNVKAFDDPGSNRLIGESREGVSE